MNEEAGVTAKIPILPCERGEEKHRRETQKRNRRLKINVLCCSADVNTRWLHQLCMIYTRRELGHLYDACLLFRATMKTAWLTHGFLCTHCSPTHVTLRCNSAGVKPLSSPPSPFPHVDRVENTLWNTDAGQRLSCNLAPVKLPSSKWPYPCDRVSCHTKPYDIKKHIHRETSEIPVAADPEIECPGSLRGNGTVGGAAVSGKVGDWD